MQLNVVTVSTRPTRVGPKIAAWFIERARAHAGFTVAPVDLAEVALPVYDEPEHPRLRRYVHEHTKRWSAIVDAADAFAFILPEYNYFAPPSLVNAFDFVLHEWGYKPCAMISYGGVSGGTRSAQMAKLHATSLKMMPIPEAVSIPFAAKLINAEGVFDPGTTQDAPAKLVLDELHKWAAALAPLRGRA
jgi:NAD(P)H-dependent FMN reductase